MSRKSAARAAAQAAEIKRSPLVFLGSAHVSCAGDGVPPSRTFPCTGDCTKVRRRAEHGDQHARRVRYQVPGPAPPTRRAPESLNSDAARPEPAHDRKPPHPSFPKAQTPFRGGVGSLRRARGADRDLSLAWRPPLRRCRGGGLSQSAYLIERALHAAPGFMKHVGIPA